MSRTIKKVAIAGANGSLGTPVTAALIQAGFEVTALSRDAAKISVPSGVKAISVDYNSLDSLKAALEGQDAVVSTIGGVGLAHQRLLVDASVTAGVKRFIPSEFGSDHTSQEARALPIYKDKVEIEEYLRQQSVNTSTSFTIIDNNAFLDWGIENGFPINVRDKTVKVFDGGDVPFTVTPLSKVAEAVVAVLSRPSETANREVRIHGATMSINKLVALAQKHTSTTGWQYTDWDTTAKSKEAYETLQKDPSNVMAWLLPMLYRAACGNGMLIDYTKINDNELLGIKSLTDEELEEIIETSVAKVA